jgi:hypothetical protein
MSVSHQTITLSTGRHRSPDDGACAVELASMLAGEPFSDRPDAVCPVIAAFLRSYNDHVDDGRRQDLYRYAALAVGTHGDAQLERRRSERCLRWARESCAPPPLRIRVLHRLFKFQGPDIDAVYAARAAAVSKGPAMHARALALLDELIAFGKPAATSARAARGGARDRQRVLD